MVQAEKKIAILHRFPAHQIRETNAAFPHLFHLLRSEWMNPLDLRPGAVNYLCRNQVDVLTFKKFNRLNTFKKFLKSLAWIFYAPALVFGKGYDVIYCDDSFPFYPLLVKWASPRSKVVLRIGDFHLMYYTSGLLYRILHHFEKMTWRKADQILAISEVMAQRIANETGRGVRVVLDPVDPLDFLSANTLKTPEKIVMFHGLLTRNKNVDVLLEAARLRPEIRFWVVGAGPDMKRLQGLAPENVWFAGWHPFRHMYSLINDCNVGVALRSANPGNEFVVTSPFLQYGAMGKPCLVTRRDVFGLYPWQFSNVEELVNKIDYLMDRPEEGEKLRRYILEKHDAKKIAEEICKTLL